MTELAPNAVILHYPMHPCGCHAQEWMFVTAMLVVERGRARGVSHVWDCLKCASRHSVGVPNKPEGT